MSKFYTTNDRINKEKSERSVHGGKPKRAEEECNKNGPLNLVSPFQLNNVLLKSRHMSDVVNINIVAGFSWDKIPFIVSSRVRGFLNMN